MSHAHSPSIPEDPATAIHVLSDRLQAIVRIAEESQQATLQMQMRLQSVATSEQVESLRREISSRVDKMDRQVGEMLFILHGPAGQQELGLLTRFGVMAQRVQDLEKLRERVTGYIIGSGLGGAAISALLQQVFLR